MPDAVQRGVAAVLAILSLPLVAILAVAIRVESPGPAIYRATRVGARGRPFTCFKLRSMASRDVAGPPLTLRSDARVTRVGGMLRRHHLDELPQLWNVVRGDMRLVGPRPEDPRFVDLTDPRHREVFTATPGITGLAQLNFKDEAEWLDDDDPDGSYRERILSRKLALDSLYLENRSTRLDLWILVRTGMAIFGRAAPTAAEVEALISGDHVAHSSVIEPVDQSGASDAEAERIRAVFERRDRIGARHPAIAEAYALINRERLDRMRAAVAAAFRDAEPRILDVGCGTGFDLAFWLSSGWQPGSLAGVDLVEERIAQARARLPGVDLRVTSGTTIPFEDGSFDIATAVTVFSSILDAGVRQALFDEMRRVVRPGGMVLVYDFVVRKPGNNDVIPMTSDRLAALGARASISIRLSPLLQLVALGTRFGAPGASIAMRIAPRTHRLTGWRIPPR